MRCRPKFRQAEISMRRVDQECYSLPANRDTGFDHLHRIDDAVELAQFIGELDVFRIVNRTCDN